MADTVVAVLLGIVTFAVVFGVITLTVRLYRTGGARQRRVLQAALVAALIVSVVQAAGSDGGDAVAFPILFTGWALLACAVVLVVTKVRERRAPHPGS